MSLLYRLPKSGALWFAVYVFVIFCATYFGLRDFSDALTSEEPLSAMIRNIGLVIGGFVAIGLAVWRGIVAEIQAKTAEKQASLAEREEESTRLLQKRRDFVVTQALAFRMARA